MRLRHLRPWRAFAACGELYLHGFRPLSRPPRSGGFESGFRLAANVKYFVEIIHIRRKISPFRGKNSVDYEKSISPKRFRDFFRALTLRKQILCALKKSSSSCLTPIKTAADICPPQSFYEERYVMS